MEIIARDAVIPPTEVDDPVDALLIAADARRCTAVAAALAARGLRWKQVRESDAALECGQCAHRVLAIVCSAGEDVECALRVVPRLRARNPACHVVFAPGEGSERLAVSAMRAGCNDYLVPRLGADEIGRCIDRYLAAAPSGDIAGTAEAAAIDDRIVCRSESMLAARRFLVKVAQTDSNVLVTGESGTGKEVIARAIHESSPRRNHPLVCVNCAALPDTLLESELFGYERGAFTGADRAFPGHLRLAAGGTLLLDEIGEMTPYAQAKVLRAVESHEVTPLGARRSHRVDLRIIAATNQDLESLVSEKRFRGDLFYRLNVARIHLPPLRERKEDVIALFEGLVEQFNRHRGTRVEAITKEAAQCLLHYDWPGNVRELRNVVEAIFVDPPAEQIDVRHLPSRLRGPALPSADNERERLIAVLMSTHWNKTEAAKQLRWSRMTLYRKLSKFHLLGSAEAPAISAGASPKPLS